MSCPSHNGYIQFFLHGSKIKLQSCKKICKNWCSPFENFSTLNMKLFASAGISSD